MDGMDGMDGMEEKAMNELIEAIVATLIAVESGGNTMAVGDGGRAVGILQMWPIAVAEANRLEEIEARREKRVGRFWALEDRENPEQSKEMARVTLRWHYRRGITDPVELACRWRNPHGDAPAWYREKIRRELEGECREGRRMDGMDGMDGMGGKAMEEAGKGMGKVNVGEDENGG